MRSQMKNVGREAKFWRITALVWHDGERGKAVRVINEGRLYYHCEK